MDLDLKDVISCPHCRYECYEDDLQEGRCPRCQRPMHPEEEDEGDDAGPAPKGPARRGPAGKGKPKGKSPPGRAGAKGPGGKGPAKPTPTPAPAKRVVLDEQFKASVFAALRKADAPTAQRLCLDKVEGNEEHAKQIYGHLLEIAKKKGWVGVDAQKPAAGPAPVAVAPVAVGPAPGDPFAAAEDCFQTMPLPSSSDPLPLPPGLLGGPPGGGPPPAFAATDGALPLPPGLLDPSLASPPGWSQAPLAAPPGAPYAPPAAGYASGVHPSAAGYPPGAGAPVPGYASGVLPQGAGYPPGAAAPGAGYASGVHPAAGGYAPGGPPPGAGYASGVHPAAGGYAPGGPASAPGYPGAPGAGYPPQGGPGFSPSDPTMAFAPGSLGPAPAFGTSDPTVAFAPGQAPLLAGAPPGPLAPQPAGGPGSGVHAVPARPGSGVHAVPARPGSGVHAVPARPGSGAHAVAPQGPPPEPDPEERGFLGRVATDGRAAQVSLLCLAGQHAAARDLAQSMLARDPFAARAHAAHGEALAGLGQDAQALQAFGNACRADPNDPVAVRGYAQLLLRLGRVPEGVAAYRRIVGPGKGDIRDVVGLATALRRLGDQAGAQRVLEELAKRDPQSLEPVRQEGEARLAQGDVEGAAEALERLLEKERPPYLLASTLAESLAPRAQASPRVAVACARALRQAGRPLPALRLLRPLLARAPQDLELRRQVGLAYARLGAGRLAEEQLVAVAQAGKAGADELLALGELYLERGDAASGIRALEQAVRARDADPDVHRALARALAAQGDLEGAVTELRRAHERAQGDQAALEDELDRITERAFLKRVRQLEERLAGEEDDPEARLALADALLQRGDVPEAVAHIERAAADAGQAEAVLALVLRHLDDAEARRPLALVLAALAQALEDPAPAVERVEAVVAEAPGDAPLRLALYRAYAAAGRMQDAVFGLQALLAEVGPPHLGEAAALAERLLEQEGYDALALPVARARRRLGDDEAAARHYARHLEADPDDLEARRELAGLHEAAGRLAEAYELLAAVLASGGGGTTPELERLAMLALGAGRVRDGVELLRRAVDRHPDDLALRHQLEAAEARHRDDQIRALREANREEDRLQLAALCAEAGRSDEAKALLRALGRLGQDEELSLLRFTAEQLARAGKPAKAEAAMRQVARALGYQPASEQQKQLLYRIAQMYEHAGERGGARRTFLELHALDPAFQDVEARLDALSEDLGAHAVGAVDERLLELVDVGAPLGTLFDVLQGTDLALDARMLGSFRTSGG